MPFIDYHTHHDRCGHAEGKLEDYIRKGVELGLKELGLSDHMPLIHIDPEGYYPGMAMPMAELPAYVEECLALKEKYKGQIEIRVGLEGDYIEGYEEEIRKIIDAYPWDYVIGSVHFLDRWDISDFRQLHEWEGRDVLEVYRRYYEAIGRAARTGFYDIIGHIDVIKRFGYAPPAEQEDEVKALERAALEAVAEAGITIELNASGLRMPAKEMFPSVRMLTYARELNIPVTLGSDAHHPDRLTQYLDQAEEALKAAGYRQLATFSARKRSLVDF